MLLALGCEKKSVDPEPGICSIAADSLIFGVVDVDFCATDSFEVSNLGTGNLQVKVTSPCPSFQVLSSPNSFTLQPNESRFVAVRFCPVDSGNLECTLSAGTSCTILASGTGLKSACQISPEVLDFGTFLQDTDSTFELTALIQNLGQTTIPIDLDDSECDEFFLTNFETMLDLGPGEDFPVTVEADPYFFDIGEHSCQISTGVPQCPILTCRITILPRMYFDDVYFDPDEDTDVDGDLIPRNKLLVMEVTIDQGTVEGKIDIEYRKTGEVQWTNLRPTGGFTILAGNIISLTERIGASQLAGTATYDFRLVLYEYTTGKVHAIADPSEFSELGGVELEHFNDD